MYFPQLKLNISAFLDYYNNEQFRELIFQFHITEAFNSEVAGLICFAMNEAGLNMNEEGLALEKLFENEKFSFPLKLGNLSLSKGRLYKLFEPVDPQALPSLSLKFVPKRGSGGLEGYVGYDLFLSTKDFLRPLEVNPCPPDCTGETG